MQCWMACWLVSFGSCSCPHGNTGVRPCWSKHKSGAVCPILRTWNDTALAFNALLPSTNKGFWSVHRFLESLLDIVCWMDLVPIEWSREYVPSSMRDMYPSIYPPPKCPLCWGLHTRLWLPLLPHLELRLSNFQPPNDTHFSRLIKGWILTQPRIELYEAVDKHCRINCRWATSSVKLRELLWASSYRYHWTLNKVKPPQRCRGESCCRLCCGLMLHRWIQWLVVIMDISIHHLFFLLNFCLNILNLLFLSLR